MIRIKKGFKGQRLVVYPYYAAGQWQRPGLQLHTMGAFPHAEHHYVERPDGCGEYILIWCTDGKGWYILNGEKTIVPASHFFILPAGHAHSYGSSENLPWSIYWTHFSGPDAASVYERLKGLREMPSSFPTSGISAAFDEIMSLLDGYANQDKAVYVDMAFPRLISAFLYPELREGHNIKAENPPGSASFVGKACHFMDENLSHKLSLSDICNHLGYSESYFTRAFTKEVGIAPMTYLMQLRATKARHLLENTNLKINQIAPMVGFSDPYYFSKFFTKEVGLSPKKYRERDRD
jgi:AraC-like DNA-binding protein